MKFLYKLLKNLICATAGLFSGYALYEILFYRNHPEIYAMNSAPWYTNILVYGAAALVICLVLGAVMWILKKYQS